MLRACATAQRGRFRRTFTLPTALNVQEVGLLHLVLPNPHVMHPPTIVLLIAGSFQPGEGQISCISCDNLGNFFQDQMAQTVCQDCPAGTQRYIGLLTAANRTSCQCKEGERPLRAAALRFLLVHLEEYTSKSPCVTLQVTTPPQAMQERHAPALSIRASGIAMLTLPAGTLQACEKCTTLRTINRRL